MRGFRSAGLENEGQKERENYKYAVTCCFRFLFNLCYIKTLFVTMSSKTIRVAVTQAEPEWLDLTAGVVKTCNLIAEAAQNGAKLITFPECWIPGYPCWIW